MILSLGDIVAQLGGELAGDPNIRINRIAPLEFATTGDLAFLSSNKYRNQLKTTKASAVIVGVGVDTSDLSAIVTPNPYLYYARVSQWLNPQVAFTPGVHSTAVVEGVVDTSATIGPNAYIARGAVIGERAVIGPNSTILNDVIIGNDTRLIANVVVYSGCVIGARCLVHAGAVIGADGFGFAREDDGAWFKIPQIGKVLVGNDVEIGAGTTIDRGALADTIIGDGVKLDNQIQIGHNVVIGEHSAMAGCVGVAGSAHIGSRCTVGGAAVILGHLSLGDDVNISSGTLVGKSVAGPGTYTGTVPFQEHSQWLKNFSRLRHLESMADKLRSLEQRMTELEEKE